MMMLVEVQDPRRRNMKNKCRQQNIVLTVLGLLIYQTLKANFFCDQVLSSDHVRLQVIFNQKIFMRRLYIMEKGPNDAVTDKWM